jgi:hypothetical protein
MPGEYLSKQITRRNLIITGIFAIAMGFFEAIVVVYLREIYYPEGFFFPLKTIEPNLFIIELIRELSTLIMLVAIGFIAGRTLLQKFAYFLYTFAVWDIFYYVALKLFLNWPPSLLTWDILFLIPITWVGPVISPVICSLTMIFLAMVILFVKKDSEPVKWIPLNWIFLLTGAVIIFITFIWDYSNILIKEEFLSELNNLAENPDFIEIITTYIPTKFKWVLFWFGEILILLSISIVLIRSGKRNAVSAH